MFKWRWVPALIIAVASYYGFVKIMGAEAAIEQLSSVVFGFEVASGERLVLRVGDCFVLLAFIFLFVEVMRAAVMEQYTKVNNILSFFLFLFSFALLITEKGFATPTFLVIFLFTILDFVNGANVWSKLGGKGPPKEK